MPEREFDKRLLDAAERLIIDRGYEGLTAADAVAAAGIEPLDPAPSDWELFTGVVKRDEDRFNGIVSAAVGKADAPEARLLALIETCVVDYDWTFWIELWSVALRDERAKDLREQLDAAFRAQIAELVEEGRAAGEFDGAEPGCSAVAIATLIDALAVEATLGDDTVSPNFMFGASASFASRLVGAELKLRGRSEDA